MHNERFAIVRSIDAGCPPEVVLAHILDPATWPEWQPEITSTHGPKTVVVGAVVDGRARMLGFDVDGRSHATQVSDRHFEEDVFVGVRMRIRYEVSADGSRTVVTHKLYADLPRGFFGGLLAFFLRRRLRVMQREALKQLVAQAEASAS